MIGNLQRMRDLFLGHEPPTQSSLRPSINCFRVTFDFSAVGIVSFLFLDLGRGAFHQAAACVAYFLQCSR
jgi:hypothetical protein